jgi:hypothetical protein
MSQQRKKLPLVAQHRFSSKLDADTDPVAFAQLLSSTVNWADRK